MTGIHWQSVSEFLAMGGYAGYVWGAYGAAGLLVIIELLHLCRRDRVADASTQQARSLETPCQR